MADLREAYDDFYIEKEPVLNKTRLYLFEQTFPDKDFKDLKIQIDDINTDDGCTHFYHMLEKIVYSYDDDEDEWFISTDPIEELMELFDF
jgi:hypothetical protein